VEADGPQSRTVMQKVSARENIYETNPASKEMRVNLIGTPRKTTGIAQDIHILHGLIAHVFGKETEIRHIPHFHPQCAEAEVNFFLEVINPSLFPYAGKNIWIPNPEWTYKTWTPYCAMVDEIWVKTHEAERLFREACPAAMIRHVGWTSIDKVMPEKKNYWKAIVPVGKNMWRSPIPILQVYRIVAKRDPSLFRNLPELHIVHAPEYVAAPPIPDEIAEKVKLHSEVLSEKDYDELLQECGLCICLSAAEGFGHAVNEAMSAGCLLMLSPIDPLLELTGKEGVLWVSELKQTPNPHCLGTLMDIEQKSLYDALVVYASSQFGWKKGKSNTMRDRYEANHKAFVERMTETLKTVLTDIPKHSLDASFPKEADLPKVSVVTITKDRRPFIPLAKYCVLAQSYPEDKLEWVIVDDGKDQIKDLVSDLPNVKYVLSDEVMTIGAKRNLGVESASHDILVMLDDDDVYPNNSILTRVAFLLAGPTPHECVFSTTIPCFDIHKKTSFMNVPPAVLGMADRVSEATLCFTRDFWMHTRFPNDQIAEAGAFIRGREHMCREVSPQDVIVSLVHKLNTSSRKPPAGEANGCHYGFSDELYTLVSEIAESI
jgi:hypothetical protein